MIGRVSIRSVMVLVLLIAVGTALLRYPSALWANVLLNACLLLYGLATIGAACSSGTRRAGLGGFAFLGGAYLVLSFGPWAQTNILPHLASTSLLAFLEGKMHPAPQAWVAEVMSATQPLPYQIYLEGQVQVDLDRDGLLDVLPVPPAGWVLDSGEFERIGHALISLILGLLGSYAAVLFHRSDRRRRCGTDSASPPDGAAPVRGMPGRQSPRGPTTG